MHGSGNFILHVDGRIYDAHCTAGDLISVPTGVAHWFDAGEQPFFTVLRVFTETSGWTPHYTGQPISALFRFMTLPVSAIVTDIEGTTTRIAFVHDVLFPYARGRLAEFLRRHAARPDVAAAVAETRRLAPGSDALDTLLGWMDADAKIGPLKALQGMIWAEGYAVGALHGDLYPDVAPALRRWRAAGIRLYVYSSGSVAAQRLLFRHASDGDLEGVVQRFFRYRRRRQA